MSQNLTGPINRRGFLGTGAGALAAASAAASAARPLPRAGHKPTQVRSVAQAHARPHGR